MEVIPKAPEPFATASELPFRFGLAFGFWELVSPDPDRLALDEPLSELAGFTESLDAELAREAQSNPSKHSSSGLSLWILVAGAAAMFAATTAIGRRRTT